MNFIRLVRGSSMGELTERDEDIIRVPDFLDRDQSSGNAFMEKIKPSLHCLIVQNV